MKRRQSMEKLNLNKLIANDIVNYGMDKTTSFNYIVSLNDFLDDYDEESIDYIKSHISDIIEAVHQNENVADLQYDEARQEFNMVFYFNGLSISMSTNFFNVPNGVTVFPPIFANTLSEISNLEEI